ncbi:hypothetical protein HaLaN_05160 [Haematococcus lacustris]|uniref:Uncharacterized protein n=1 Tax=Haematococcus lacustris TaxID=44745 RepID=A0A699YU46_HAELA|nr:hypothetical protein HaLaN_05160 [Haematococcus lacustris]
MTAVDIADNVTYAAAPCTNRGPHCDQRAPVRGQVPGATPATGVSKAAVVNHMHTSAFVEMSGGGACKPQ